MPDCCTHPQRPRSLLCYLRHGITTLIVVVTSGAHSICAANADDIAANPRRPNFVLVLADDLGYSDLGCYGGEIETPNLDRLAGDGLRFTQFYNCAVCVATRAALLTGLHPRHGRSAWLHRDMITLGEAMRASGYQTSLTGKWHSAPDPTLILRIAAFKSGTDSEAVARITSGRRRRPGVYNGGNTRPFFHNLERCE